MDIKIVIPARYESTRLPGKPLIPLNGISMIRRTYLQCCKAFNEKDIFIATDDDRIVDHCNALNMPVIKTSSSCLTGTDRIAEFANKVKADIYINVQGDEPLINPDDITKIANVALQNPQWIINGYAEIVDESEFRSSSIPKVVFKPDGNLLYMSRQAIPTTKSWSFIKAWKQICIYAFPLKALAAFASVKVKTPLESIEDIEILRFLELGYEVKMVPLSGTSMAVDTPEDISKVEMKIKELE